MSAAIENHAFKARREDRQAGAFIVIEQPNGAQPCRVDLHESQLREIAARFGLDKSAEQAQELEKQQKRMKTMLSMSRELFDLMLARLERDSSVDLLEELAKVDAMEILLADWCGDPINQPS